MTTSISRRNFMALGAAAAATLTGSSEAQVPKGVQNIPGPANQKVRFSKTDLWVQLTTGGVSYPGSFQEMFLDPMFIGMQIWPIDQPASFAALAPGDQSSRPATPSPVSVAKGRSALGGGTEHLEPDDYPWEPSGGRPHPGYDVIVLNDQINWSPDQRKAAKSAAEAGRGFVLLHNSLGDNQDWPWWYKEVTGGLFLLDGQDGMKKSTATKGTSLILKPVGTHPILRNVGPLNLTGEEAYKGMWQAPNITPILETSSPASDKTVAWIGIHPTAKVVCIQAGTSRETHHNPAYRMLVRNAILWAGGRLI